MAIYKNITQLIGNTPLIELVNYNKTNDLAATIIAKVESFNPAGSVKDRVAFAMINDAIEKKQLTKNTTIVEPTSGNTGIGIAAIAAAMGYKVILTMPESMSMERRKLLKAYGAKLVLTDAKLAMKGAIDKALEIAQEIGDAFVPGQFDNSANVYAHYTTTGPEIDRDTKGKVDILVATIGTGGTITGVGNYLKEKNPKIKIIAVEPTSSSVLSGGTAGPHKIQGIGAGFVPSILDTTIYDEIITVTNEEAINTAKEVTIKDGILVGISSGAALYAATIVAKRVENNNKNIIVIFPDTGERYLSTELFD